jgi:two-component system cell cycle response regulator
MESILASIQLRGTPPIGNIAEIIYRGQHFRVTTEHQRILDLLFSTYEATIIRNQELQETQKALSEKVVELETALEKVKQLEGIVPICSFCKKIRNDEDYWQQIDQFIADHSDVQFSHGLCPDCAELHYSKYMKHPGEDEA